MISGLVVDDGFIGIGTKEARPPLLKTCHALFQLPCPFWCTCVTDHCTWKNKNVDCCSSITFLMSHISPEAFCFRKEHVYNDEESYASIPEVKEGSVEQVGFFKVRVKSEIQNQSTYHNLHLPVFKISLYGNLKAKFFLEFFGK